MPQLLNTLVTAEQVRETPSRKDGVSAALEEELRAWGCQCIQQAGILLRLPQVTMATAQVLFQRFWYISSLAQFGMRETMMGALFLACKLEETPKRVRSLINVFDFLLRTAKHSSKCNPGPRAKQLRRARGQRLSDTTTMEQASAKASEEFVYRPMAYFAKEFYDVKDDLVIAEMQLLKRLGFQVQVNLPYAIMVNYLKLLGLITTSSSSSKGHNDDAGSVASASREGEAESTTTPPMSVAQRAWAILNDALQTPVYVMFPPHVIAAASIYLVSITMDSCPPLPLTPHPWWELLDVSRSELRIVSSHLVRLYDAEGTDRWSERCLKTAGVDDAFDQSFGLAARVRDEWGGMVDFASRSAVRDWIRVYGSNESNRGSQKDH